MTDLISALHLQKVSAAFRGGGYSTHAIWIITYPVIIDTLFSTAVDFVNTGIISSNGPAAISAVNTVNSIHWVMFGIFTSIGLGITVLVSQYFGLQEKQKIGEVSAAGLQTMLIASIGLSGLVLIFEDPITHVLFGSAAPDVANGIHIFLFGMLVSYPMRSFYLFADGTLRGIARTKITLVLSLIANGSNVLFNILFVTFLHWGMVGLSAAVILSQAIGAVVGGILMSIYSKELHFTWIMAVQFHFGMIRKVVNVSIPFILENLFFNGGKLIIQIIIVPFGTLQIAANGIIQSWNHFADIIPSALSTAIVPIVGSSVGAKNYGYVRKITNTFIKTGTACLVVVVALQAALFYPVMTGFYHAPEAIHGTLWILFLINSAGYLTLFSGQSILPSTLRAAGDGAYATKAALASMWIYRIGVGYLVSVVFNFQIVGIWAVWVTEWGVRYLLFWLRYRGTKWEQHQLTEPTEKEA